MNYGLEGKTALIVGGATGIGFAAASMMGREGMRIAVADINAESAHLGAERLTAGWFADNPASGHVLEKLGFAGTDAARVFCVARGCEVLSNRVQLTREQFARKKAA